MDDELYSTFSFFLLNGLIDYATNQYWFITTLEQNRVNQIMTDSLIYEYVQNQKKLLELELRSEQEE